MADDQEREQEPEQSRRFRFSRKVKTEPVKTDAERAMAELDQEEDADKGSPELQAFTRKGCGGCLSLTVLIFVIMITSIIGTCYIRR